MILRTMTLSIMMPCLSINNARTLRIMTLRMMTFSLLTNNVGQNDTITTLIMMSFGSLTYNAGKNDTYNKYSLHDVILHIGKQC